MDVENFADREQLKAAIKELKEQKKAVIMAHYYVKGDVQDVADYIGDSLALARIASQLDDARIIVLCGVYFMGETAKLLCPDKKVLLPDATAGCSLADSCEAGAFKKFIDEHPDHTVISYVNTSVGVKALTDILVTSGNALKIINSLPADEKIIFGPDRNLGTYINNMTGRDMLLWDGACHVHEKFSFEKILELKEQHPDAKLLVHPECRRQLVMIADKVGSTAALLEYAKSSDAKEFIVATESGILHQMKKDCTDKIFIAAPPSDSTCGCNDCQFMKLNTLEKLYHCLLTESPEVKIDESLAEAARKPIERMLAMS